MRPGVAPAIASKALAGKAVSGKVKSAPVASAAEAAPRGEIHVKTSGLIFDQNSGVATTSKHVDFSMVQGAAARWVLPTTRKREFWCWTRRWS